MLRTNFLIFILVITISSFSLAQPKIDENPITIAANNDSITNNDLGKWYAVYNGVYLYGDKMNFEGCNNFGDVFEKMAKVRDVLQPSKSEEFGKAVNSIFEKYKTVPFDDNGKNQFLEDCNKVAVGIKGAID